MMDQHEDSQDIRIHPNMEMDSQENSCLYSDADEDNIPDIGNLIQQSTDQAQMQ